MPVGELIHTARLDAGLSQAQLARLAETSQSALARYESGVTEPSLGTLERVLAACGARLRLTVTADETARGSGATSARAQLGPDARALRRVRPRILEAAAAHGIRRVRVFGSIARGQASTSSDVDLLVDLAPGRTLIDVVAFQRDATELLGTDVDVATVDMLKPAIRGAVVREAIPL